MGLRVVEGLDVRLARVPLPGLERPRAIAAEGPRSRAVDLVVGVIVGPTHLDFLCPPHCSHFLLLALEACLDMNEQGGGARSLGRTKGRGSVGMNHLGLTLI